MQKRFKSWNGISYYPSGTVTQDYTFSWFRKWKRHSLSPALGLWARIDSYITVGGDKVNVLRHKKE